PENTSANVSQCASVLSRRYCTSVRVSPTLFPGSVGQTEPVHTGLVVVQGETPCAQTNVLLPSWIVSPYVLAPEPSIRIAPKLPFVTLLLSYLRVTTSPYAAPLSVESRTAHGIRLAAPPGDVLIAAACAPIELVEIPNTRMNAKE